MSGAELPSRVLLVGNARERTVERTVIKLPRGERAATVHSGRD